MELPAGIHAKRFDARNIVTGEWLHYAVVWSDRDYDECNRCGEPVQQIVECPATLHTGCGLGGEILPFDQKHGCGEWLSVRWEELDGLGEPLSDLEIEIAARTLSES
jgi:hypothetical protein